MSRAPVGSSEKMTSQPTPKVTEILSAAGDMCGEGRAGGGHGLGDAPVHDEDLAYAERLTQAGVPCHVEVVQGAFHIFDQVVPKAAVSQAFFTSQCASLRTALAPKG